jgi:hypothetical protein
MEDLAALKEQVSSVDVGTLQHDFNNALGNIYILHYTLIEDKTTLRSLSDADRTFLEEKFAILMTEAKKTRIFCDELAKRALTAEKKN